MKKIAHQIRLIDIVCGMTQIWGNLLEKIPYVELGNQ